MPVPSPRNSIRIARGNFADLSANSTAFGDGEFIYAIDQDRFYTADSGVLFPVGRGVVAVESIDTLADVDTSTIAPGVGSVLKWDGTNWVPGTDENTDAVTSVNTQTGDVVLDADDISDAATTNKFATQTELDKLANIEAGAQVNTVDSVAGKTGDVTLVKADITDFSDADYATAAQGATADTALQPGDSVSDLTNDANYIDAAGAPIQSVNSQTGNVVLGASDVGLGNVDNTSDANKPVSTAQQTVLDAKADLVGGVVPTSQIPSIAITEYLGAVASEVAMLALTGQEGDWCNRTDTSSTFVITGSDPSVIGSWTELSYPVDAVTSVNTQTGTVVLGPSDVGAATAAQGLLADSAVQPTDSINVLADVDISTTAPTDGQALIWDNTGGKFVPGEAGLVDSVNSQTGDVVLDTDDVTEGSTNLYSQWDNATGGINYAGGKVGIGTTDPVGTLNVNGTGAAPSLTYDTGNLVNLDQGGIQLAFGVDSASPFGCFLQGRDANNLARSLLLNPVGGNVGIGTTDPQAKLNVFGTDQTSTELDSSALTAQFQSTTGSVNSGASLGLGVSAREPFAAINSLFQNGNDNGIGDLAFNLRGTGTDTGLSEVMRLKYNGKVGIGTIAPAAQLHVVSPITGGGDIAYFDDTGSGSTGRFTISTTGGTGSDGIRLGCVNRTTLELGGASGPAVLAVNPVTSRVGIGTTTPAKLLDVNGDALINGMNVGRGAGNGSSNTAVGNSALNANTTGYSNLALGQNALLSNTTGFNNAAVGQNSLQANTEGDSNTGVGQGTLVDNTTGSNNTALGQLSLNANTEGDANTAVGRNALVSNITGSLNTAVGRNAGRYIEGSNNTVLGAYQGTTADATLNDTVIISAGPTERLRIDSDGNVGIGTTNPSASLEVYRGTITVTDPNSITTGDTGLYGALWSQGAVLTQAGFQIAFNTGNNNARTERARIDNSGRLLVGTSNSVNALVQAGLQVQSTDGNAYMSIGRWRDSTANPGLIFNKSRGVSVGTRGVVQSGDNLGEVSFTGDDGSAFVYGARIQASVDGTPGTDDMPGRLVFSTTASGASTPTERMRIKSDGTVNFSNAAVYADNTAALAGGLVAGDVYRKSDGTLMITF